MSLLRLRLEEFLLLSKLALLLRLSLTGWLEYPGYISLSFLNDLFDTFLVVFTDLRIVSKATDHTELFLPRFWR